MVAILDEEINYFDSRQKIIKKELSSLQTQEAEAGVGAKKLLADAQRNHTKASKSMIEME